MVGLASLMRATARAAALEPGAKVGPNLRRRSCKSWVADERSNAKGDVGTDADAVKEAEEEADAEAEEEAEEKEDAEADAEREEEAEEKEDAEAEENHAGKDASRCGNAAGTRSSLRALVGVSIAESVL